MVPEEFSALVRERADQLNHSQEERLLAGYREMAADSDREAQAREWSDGLIADENRHEG